ERTPAHGKFERPVRTHHFHLATYGREQVKAVVIGKTDFATEHPTVEHKLVAAHQLFPPGWLKWDWGDGSHRSTREVDCRQCLVDVERTRTPLSVTPVPVVQTVSRVARLLKLGDHDPCPECVDRPCLDQQVVTRARFELMKEFRASPV